MVCQIQNQTENIPKQGSFSSNFAAAFSTAASIRLYFLSAHLELLQVFDEAALQVPRPRRFDRRINQSLSPGHAVKVVFLQKGPTKAITRKYSKTRTENKIHWMNGSPNRNLCAELFACSKLCCSEHMWIVKIESLGHALHVVIFVPKKATKKISGSE